MAVINPPQILTNGLGGQVLWDGSGNLIVQPQSGLALQAQATTSSSTGGNARGANAVDWQTSRSSATQVANGQYAVLVGGNANTVSGTKSAVLGGDTNNASGAYSFIGGGYSNGSATQVGYYNFIGGGQSNTGTLTAAVTTQATSTITSGSTAVTLSGSNASIKVGQFISGTPIANNTYVAAISGTSLTLSQNATSSTNATLSFYTPHGVVVGGGNNQATGSYSFIGGGGDAGTAANRNVASGDWSTVGGGNKNTASGLLSTVAGGLTCVASGEAAFVGGGGSYGSFGQGGNTASGLSSSIVSGYSNTSSNNFSFIAAGRYNTASGTSSSVVGSYGTTRGITGYIALAAADRALNQTTGATQSGLLNVATTTTTTGAVALTSDGTAASTTNQVILPNGQTSTVSVYTFRVLISAHNSANTTDIAGWEIKGVISRGNGVGTTALVGTPTVTLLGATSGAISAGWGTVSNVAAVADTTNGALQIQVTGVASTTIRWSARVETNELAY